MSQGRKDKDRRSLSEEERVLWSTVTRAIAPLRPRVPAEATVFEAPAPPAASRIVEPERPMRPIRPPVTAAPIEAPAPPVATFERRLRQRLGRGSEPIDGRVDLHGLTQAEAHVLLERFVRAAAARGARVVLVITGKGTSRGAASEGERGVLRRQVPHWLKARSLRDYVIGFTAAHVGHGGEGALYVRLRRARRSE
jgi:DNA-nicking Smr family endonuclease